MEGIYSPAEETAEGQCRSMKRKHNKDKILCCGCGQYFFYSLTYMTMLACNKMVARPTDSEVF